jgi:hypothetical protein
MNFCPRIGLLICANCVWVALAAQSADAQYPYQYQIGLTQLPVSLNGSGVTVGQVEAPMTSGGNDYEVNPTVGSINYPQSQVTYISSTGVSATGTPPNSAGTESSHADSVGEVFYGTVGAGVATGVAHVNNYNANYYYNTLIVNQTATTDKVVNQSFTFGAVYSDVDQNYDNYTARYNTIFVSAAGPSGTPTSPDAPTSPGTPYNTIAVNGPNGSGFDVTAGGGIKPDIFAPASPPGGDTSYVTPEVAGSAAILVQAAGSNTAAADNRTIKALLMNGAVKPSGWTRTTTTPLDPNYGAGVLSVFNSYEQLIAGQHGDSLSNSSTTPITTGGIVPATGWNRTTITSSSLTNGANHYLFSLTGTGTYAVSATLVWDRDSGQSGINNLELLLYNAATDTLVDSSIGTADNVQDVYQPNLPPGLYDLEVVKLAGTVGQSGYVSDSETYSLAFSVPECSSALLMAVAGTGLLLRRCRPDRLTASLRSLG